MGLAVCDFKGPFACARDGAETSVLGFKHPYSGYVHEFYLTNQNVSSAVASFDEFQDIEGCLRLGEWHREPRCRRVTWAPSSWWRSPARQVA
jgi:hypothetical protein